MRGQAHPPKNNSYKSRVYSRLFLLFMDNKTIQAIEAILAKGDRVELIPTKDGVKVIHIKRESVKV